MNFSATSKHNDLQNFLDDFAAYMQIAVADHTRRIGKNSEIEMKREIVGEIEFISRLFSKFEF
jgi:hypothetical protein